MKIKYLPYRLSHRLRGHDYSGPGAYFVTICTDRNRCIFGDVRSCQMHLNELGEIVREEWLKTAKLRPGIKLDIFEIMPNHMHSIIVLEVNLAAGLLAPLPVASHAGDRPVAPTGPKAGSLGAILGNFKGAVSGRIRKLLRKPEFEVWERGYYDHVIEDDDQWQAIRAYILDNPLNWLSDTYNPGKL